MADIAPDRLILKCYGYKIEENKWVGICLNFNLAVEAESPEGLVEKTAEVVASYIETVLDTKNRESIPELLSRRAPIGDWLKYYLIYSAILIMRIKKYFTFKEAIPFHLAHSCLWGENTLRSIASR